MKASFLLAMATILAPTSAHGRETRAGWIKAEAKQQILAYQLAECVVNAAPVLTAEMLSTLPGSDQENTVNRRLDAPIKSCWKGGDTLKLGKMLFRGAVAEVMYRRMATGSDPSLVDPYKDAQKN